MICSKCENIIKEGEKFCSNCGNRVAESQTKAEGSIFEISKNDTPTAPSTPTVLNVGKAEEERKQYARPSESIQWNVYTFNNAKEKKETEDIEFNWGDTDFFRKKATPPEEVAIEKNERFDPKAEPIMKPIEEKAEPEIIESPEPQEIDQQEPRKSEPFGFVFEKEETGTPKEDVFVAAAEEKTPKVVADSWGTTAEDTASKLPAWALPKDEGAREESIKKFEKIEAEEVGTLWNKPVSTFTSSLEPVGDTLVEPKSVAEIIDEEKRGAGEAIEAELDHEKAEKVKEKEAAQTPKGIFGLFSKKAAKKEEIAGEVGEETSATIEERASAPALEPEISAPAFTPETSAPALEPETSAPVVEQVKAIQKEASRNANIGDLEKSKSEFSWSELISEFKKNKTEEMGPEKGISVTTDGDSGEAENLNEPKVETITGAGREEGFAGKETQDIDALISEVFETEKKDNETAEKEVQEVEGKEPFVDPKEESLLSELFGGPKEQNKKEAAIEPSAIPFIEPEAAIEPSVIPFIEPEAAIEPSAIPFIEPEAAIEPAKAEPTFEPTGEKENAETAKSDEEKEIEKVIEGKELEDLLFEEVTKDALERTTKVNKFYTFNRKNEEFQRLLDEEYEKYQQEKTEDNLIFSEYVAEKKFNVSNEFAGILSAEHIEEMAKARELFFADPEEEEKEKQVLEEAGKPEELPKEIEKEMASENFAEEASKRIDAEFEKQTEEKATTSIKINMAGENVQEVKKENQAALGGASSTEEKLAAKEQKKKEKRDKKARGEGGAAGKVIIGILAGLIVVTVAVLAIKFIAPTSAFTETVNDAILKIIGLFQ